MVILIRQHRGAFKDPPVTVATLTLESDGTVTAEGEQESVDFAHDYALPVMMPEGRRIVTIEDGRPWLENLPRCLRGMLVWAEPGDATAHLAVLGANDAP